MGGRAAGPAVGPVPRRTARRPGRPPQDPQQRHRLPLPAALGVLPPHRARHRPGAGRRAGARATPADGGHDAVLFFSPRAERDTEEFYADARYGELWVGVRPTLEEISALTGIRPRTSTRPPTPSARTSDPAASSGSSARPTRASTRSSTRSASHRGGAAPRRTPSSPRRCRELRLVKDAWEVEQMRARRRGDGAAASRTSSAPSPRPSRPGRGERVSRAFGAGPAARATTSVRHDRRRRARTRAPCTGSATTARSAGRPAALDAGSRSTRCTPPTSPGRCPSRTFTEAQRRVYEVVLEAQDAGVAEVRPGADFLERTGPRCGSSPALRRVGLLPRRRASRTTLRRTRASTTAAGCARHRPHARHRRPRLRAGPRRRTTRRASSRRAWSSPSSPGCTSRPTT